MKRTLAFLTALLLAVSLTACGETSVWQEPATVPQTNESLTVFCIGEGRHVNLIQTALDIYQKMHPDVEVELIRPLTEYSYSGDVPEQEAYDRLAVQIMAGEGPDVFIIDDFYMDVEKLVRQGLLADMEPFFEADGFDWEPYNQAVMDSGVWNGQRFVISNGIGWYIQEGKDGFSSTTRTGSALNSPSQEEIRQLLDLTQEITGGYYYNEYLCPTMHFATYFYGGADFDETLEEAQRAMEIYISE